VPANYADSPYVIANRQVVSRSGDVLTLPLLLSRNPIEDREAATKGYTDIHTGGALFGTNIIPSVIDAWYTHNAPGTPVAVGSATDFGDWSLMVPMFVGRTATWQRISITHGGGFGPRVALGIWSMNPATLLPVALLTAATVETPLGTNYTVGTYGVPLVQTTTAWIGLAVHGHGTGGGWFTFDIDKNTAGTGQFNYKTYGFTSTLTEDTGGNVLATIVGGDGGVMPTDPALYVPYNYSMPSMGVQLYSVP